MKFEACKKATSGLSVACFGKTLAPPCLNSNRVISLSSLLPEANPKELNPYLKDNGSESIFASPPLVVPYALAGTAEILEKINMEAKMAELSNLVTENSTKKDHTQTNNQVNVDYLTKPLDVFKEMCRILKPGVLAIMR
ncbi:hypothetical protein JHK87_055263 [Glycine soja]|nr:hypothetical protein JHK87_055263 [Glycine soja]